jgi:hypothetical protein
MGPADADQDLGTSDVTPELKKTVADGVLQEARDRSWAKPAHAGGDAYSPARATK